VSSFAIKPYAIWRSQLREVLWIDADNAPLRDPEFLFDDPEYVAKGSLFWRDVTGPERIAMWHWDAPVWDTFNVPPNDSEEFESGQLLIDKARCWVQMALTIHFNSIPDVYHKMVYGDKDTFRFAWQNLDFGRTGRPPKAPYHGKPELVPYGFMPYGPFHMGRPNGWGKWGGGTILVQRDREGAPLFNHRNLQKFHLGENHFNKDITNEAIYHGHVEDLRQRLEALRNR
jgi:alpha 1,2-mannosyltransferase